MKISLFIVDAKLNKLHYAHNIMSVLGRGLVFLTKDCGCTFCTCADKGVGTVSTTMSCIAGNFFMVQNFSFCE